MNLPSLLRLIGLSAIWGASFLFMRVAVPVLGPTYLIAGRVVLAAVFLWLVARWLRKPLALRANARHYLVIGFLNSALPFMLFAYAARTISASLLSILNATAPIWGALIGAVWTRTPLTPKAMLGLALGIGGVALLAGVESLALPPGGIAAMAAAVGAAFCYGIATTYTKTAPSVEPFANAHGAMWAATLMTVPLLLVVPAPATPLLAVGATIVASVVALGVLCSGVAYLIYFRLIADLGATSALTVTFLIPAFGVLWGHSFLGEAVGWHTLAGAAVVLLGTALVTGFSPAALRRAASTR